MTAIDPVKLALRTERLRAAMHRPEVRARLSEAARLRDPATRDTKPLPPMEPQVRRVYRHLREFLSREAALAEIFHDSEPRGNDG